MNIDSFLKLPKNRLYLDLYRVSFVRSTDYVFFVLFILVYSISVVPTFPPLASSTQPTPHSHRPSPHHCPCPWAIHTCSLTNPFPFFPPFPPYPLAAGSLFHVSVFLIQFCSLVYFVH